MKKTMLIVVFFALLVISCSTSNPSLVKNNAAVVDKPILTSKFTIELSNENIIPIGEFDITKTITVNSSGEWEIPENVSIGLSWDDNIDNATIDYMKANEYLYRIVLFEIYSQYPEADYYLYPNITYSKDKGTPDKYGNAQYVYTIRMKGTAIKIKI